MSDRHKENVEFEKNDDSHSNTNLSAGGGGGGVAGGAGGGGGGVAGGGGGGTNSDKVAAILETVENLKIFTDAFSKKLEVLEKNSRDNFSFLKREFEVEIEESKRLNKEEIQKNKEEIQKNKISLIEALSIFVALFTFISINIQVFTRVSNLLSASIIIFFMLMCLLIWSFVTSLVLKDSPQTIKDVKKDWRTWCSGGCLFFAFLSIIAFDIFNIPINPVAENTDLQKEIQKTVDEKVNFILKNQNDINIMSNKKLLDFKRCLWNNGFTYYCLNDLD